MSGIIILPIFIFYVIVGTILLKLILKLFNKKLNIIFVFLIVLFLPFLDLFIQKGIKTFYQITFLTSVKVYGDVQRDKDGKIESLNIIDYSNLREFKLYSKKYYNIKKRTIKNMIEVTANINNKKEKVRLNLHDYTFKIINKSEARYTLKKIKTKITHFGLSNMHEVHLIDNKTNKIIASAKSIIFTDTYAFLRRDVLLLITGTGRDMFWVSGVGDGSRAIEKKFKL